MTTFGVFLRARAILWLDNKNQQVLYRRFAKLGSKRKASVNVSLWCFSFKSLREDMNEISGRMDEVTELATDWAQNSDPSSSTRLTNEITSLSERFGSVSTRLIKKEKELEDILVKWQRFESSCSDMQAWIESQTAVLNETVTVDVPLTLQLQQLSTCQVRTLWRTMNYACPRYCQLLSVIVKCVVLVISYSYHMACVCGWYNRALIGQL